MSSATVVNSPCINVCVIDADTGYCFGCFRTLEEIAGWGSYAPADKAAVLDELERRRAEADADD